ncbi:flagellar brake protein [Aquabacterium sp.]|uniref:flagellar brake protein n=1 Tax=Aquabacterium sp. TaxID=1872578 RepID=UPI0025C54F57|nr:flagellar brake protein [Aquabacterium sp.]
MNQAPDLDDFRITSPVEILAFLRQLQEGHVLVTLSGPGGASYSTLLWSLDTQRQTISFSAEDGDARLQALLEGNEVVAVAYLDSIKLQFDVDGLVRVRGGQHQALNGSLPRVLYRFQRRGAFRVRPLSGHTPMATFRHPALPDMALSLRVIDVSLGGIALFLPDNVPMIPAGVRINHCQVTLDDETRLDVGLVIHHVTVINPEAKGARLGCELLGLDHRDRSLQHYVNQTQKRRLALPPGKG